MSMTKEEALSRLSIEPEKKARKKTGPYAVLLIVALLLVAGALVLRMTKTAERKPIPLKAVAASPTNVRWPNTQAA